MSVLEICLIVAMGIGLAIYIGFSIDELVHPQKYKDRRAKRKAKRLAKKGIKIEQKQEEEQIKTKDDLKNVLEKEEQDEYDEI